MSSSGPITQAEWEEAQTMELASWTTHAFPNFQGKQDRERGYQREVLQQLGWPRFSGVAVEVGCGPVPVLEQVSGDFIGIAVDPLIPEYAKTYPIWGWKSLPAAMRAEDLDLPDRLADHVLSVNALDHFQDPIQALVEMVRILKPEGMLWLQFCIENASKGNPHPAHKIDLTPEVVKQQLGATCRRIGEQIAEYGWRRQPSYLGVYQRL